MFRKHRRILWLLNHKTLMPYEVPLMQRLGFEVFVPKIFPKTLRNSAIDPSFDASLSVPASVLRLLNAFNFYEDVWTAEIVTVLNRYFGCAFVIPHSRGVQQAVDQFEGQIVLRAFGLENDSTYRQFLEDLYGPMILRKIAGIQDRFWFGEGYDHLHEIEPALFKQRGLFLPIGIPESLFATAGQWTGKDHKILFVCPNAVTDPYYSRIYQQFKRDFGDLPHVIVGAQDVPIDDPHAAGFVSDAELKRLYLECAVLYYHSIEVRHVHYSPVEAAINGMPVVFHADSFLGRLSRGADKGQVTSVAEARALIERILANDRPLISAIRQDQREIAYLFSDAYCGPMWKRQMEERGFMKAMSPRSPIAILAMELARTLLKPYAHGRLRADPHQPGLKPALATLTAHEAREAFGASLYDGLAFNAADFPPPVIDFVDGVGLREDWGRWSNGAKITIVLKHKLEGRFRLWLHAIGYAGNAGVPVPVRIGNQMQTAKLSGALEDARPQWLTFDLSQPASVIEIDVPHPIRPDNDLRELGIGLIAIGAAPPITLNMADARAELGASLEDGWSIGDPVLPGFVDSLEGACPSEGWGRWSNGDKITVVLKHNLSGSFRFMLHAVGFQRNAGAPVAIRLGSEVRIARLAGNPQEARPQWVHFDLAQPTNVIEIDVPYPTRPEGDTRDLGIGLIAMSASQPVVMSLKDARARLGSTLDDGWRFNEPETPAFVQSVEGLYDSEAWGRWSQGDKVVFELKHLLEGRFQLQLRAVGFGPNAGAPVQLRVGSQQRTISLPSVVGEPILVQFDLAKPSNLIELDVPSAVSPPGDHRRLGIGFYEIRLLGPAT